MIQANELMIGNLVLDGNGEITTVESIVENAINYCLDFGNLWTDEEYYFENLNPIPITEEWLFKFGFEKGANDWYGIIYNTDWSHDELNCDEIMKIDYNVISQRLAIYDNIEESDMVNILSYPIYTANQIKYVHQLQNLYFAMTQKELCPTNK